MKKIGKQENRKTGKQEKICGNGSNDWIKSSVLAINSPIYYQTGIAFDGKYLYIAEQHGIYRLNLNDKKEIRKFELYAGKPKEYGFVDNTNRLDARFLNIRALSVTPEGNLLIADTGNNRIRSIGHDGIVKTIAGNGKSDKLGKIGIRAIDFPLKEPLHAIKYSNGDTYIADSLNNVVVRVDQDGVVSEIIGTLNKTNYQGMNTSNNVGENDDYFNTPSYIYINNDKIIVTDASSVKWANINKVKDKCWIKIPGDWYYPNDTSITSRDIIVNNTGSNSIIKLDYNLTYNDNMSYCK
ncbi:NHL repeat-containing protein [Photorhabdus antumapuensis]|uniref:hypothetical protein n=1 Tax=Photorhabdus antumapuensis TaxID=2862867 RepID=UPI001CECC40D|nr:hypothetical protein [Photorhabdus antumapuensis]MCA6222224.1 hypothetical protein [Photorhabdus antumapuensis]